MAPHSHTLDLSDLPHTSSVPCSFPSTPANKDTLLLLLGVDDPLHVAHEGALDGVEVIREPLQQLHLRLPQLGELPLLAPQDAHHLVLELCCHLHEERTSIHF